MRPNNHGALLSLTPDLTALFISCRHQIIAYLLVFKGGAIESQAAKGSLLRSFAPSSEKKLLTMIRACATVRALRVNTRASQVSLLTNFSGDSRKVGDRRSPRNQARHNPSSSQP